MIAQTGKPLVPRAADNFYYFAEMCTRTDGHTYPSTTDAQLHAVPSGRRVRADPPWNVPFMTATWKTAPCLAFGNTAVLKMSELSPISAAMLGELVLEAGVPPGVLNVVHGTGKGAGEALVRHPDVRAISFTGSTPPATASAGRGPEEVLAWSSAARARSWSSRMPIRTARSMPPCS